MKTWKFYEKESSRSLLAKIQPYHFFLYLESLEGSLTPPKQTTLTSDLLMFLQPMGFILQIYLSTIKKNEKGVEKMAQSIKCQPCKLEGLSSDPQSPCKKPGVLQMPIIPVLERQRQEEPWDQVACMSS